MKRKLMDLQQKIESVRTAEATKMFYRDIEIYGGKAQALRALDCKSQEEAIKMLREAVHFSIFIANGEIVVATR